MTADAIITSQASAIASHLVDFLYSKTNIQDAYQLPEEMTALEAIEKLAKPAIQDIKLIGWTEIPLENALLRGQENNSSFRTDLTLALQQSIEVSLREGYSSGGREIHYFMTSRGTLSPDLEAVLQDHGISTGYGRLPDYRITAYNDGELLGSVDIHLSHKHIEAIWMNARNAEAVLS